MTVSDNTNLRLKAVLDILAAGTWAEEKPGAGVVLAEAIARVPLNAEEGELLSGGIPRGHKTLTTATAKLVKAGWLVKGRGGWTITEDGLRATVEFPDAASLTAALAAGTQVSAETPLPAAPPAPAAEAVEAKEAKAPAKKTQAKKPAAKAKSTAKAEPTAKAEAGQPAVQQPASVAIAGDFGTLLGANEDWAPQAEQVQMNLDEDAQLWKLTVALPQGFYKFKAVVNGSWDENYGAFGVADGFDHELHHDGGEITFRYDHATNDVLTTA
ncbi:pullulanase X25 domain-containing protein [Arthrobacter sp. 35W]|uniref:pullulanase X25 domain-containing protein n=1 Tax=Arthrobacter sp. 35W TaxID=1132441 RepID=UPI0003FF2C13|nr:glycosidase [Arthrobacter sp. 35W]